MKAPGMKSSHALSLQMAIVLLGLGALGFLLGEPHLEGRNAHATVAEIYFHDPFLAYAYVGAVPFFVALYWAFGLLEEVRLTGRFSPATLSALRAIRRCALVLIAFVAGAAVFILNFGDREDRSPGLFICAFVILAASLVAAATTFFARNLQSALNRTD